MKDAREFLRLLTERLPTPPGKRHGLVLQDQWQFKTGICVCRAFQEFRQRTRQVSDDISMPFVRWFQPDKTPRDDFDPAIALE